MASREADDLNRPDGRRLGAWPDDDSGVLSDLSEQVGGLVQQLLEPAVRGFEEGADPLRGDGVEATGCGHVVDEESVSLVGGNATGGCVRLRQVALLFEDGHLVAHRGRADSHSRQLGNVRRTDRLSGGDVLLHDGSEDGGLAFVEHLAVKVIDCQRGRAVYGVHSCRIPL